MRQYFSSIDKSSIYNLLIDCYPLHPISCLILPILSQKIAQNERTIFSFITSSQVQSLSYWLSKLEMGEFVKPHHIYDVGSAMSTPQAEWERTPPPLYSEHPWRLHLNRRRSHSLTVFKKVFNSLSDRTVIVTNVFAVDFHWIYAQTLLSGLEL